MTNDMTNDLILVAAIACLVIAFGGGVWLILNWVYGPQQHEGEKDMERQRGSLLAEIIIGLGIAALLAAILVPVIVRSLDQITAAL
jgi:uncharacterized membrane protein SpoIIM required for sporulation